MLKNSSETGPGKTLARKSRQRLELFLQTLANARDVMHLSRVAKLYADFFPESFPQATDIARRIPQLPEEGFPGMMPTSRMVASIARLHEFAFGLRHAWDEKDERIKDWHVYELRRKFHDEMNPESKGEPPAFTPFEQAMFHFIKISSLAKNCANSDCAKPYFIAEKKSFKYCSPACSAPAQRAFKREWWAEHGPGWRERRTLKSKCDKPGGKR